MSGRILRFQNLIVRHGDSYVFRVFKGAAVTLAAWGMVFPNSHLLASEQKLPDRPVIKVTAANSILDVTLSKDGALTGRVIDHGGLAVVGAKVIVKQGKNTVVEAITDQSGNFAAPNLKSGVYDVTSGSTGGSYRVWTEKTAPPAAMPHALLVLGENGAGENLGLILLCATTGLALAALVVAIHAENIADAANKNSQSP